MSDINDTNNFSQDTAIELLQSKKQFPVSFAAAWQWAEYSRKDKGLNMLKSNFVEGEDYISTKAGKNGLRGRSSVFYSLTVDCFKMFGMMAGTPKGREIRRYFLDCEKQLKEAQANPVVVQTQHTQVEKIQSAQAMLDICDRLGFSGNPRFDEAIKDQVGDLLGVSQPRLPGAAPVEEWYGVVERGEQIGYRSSVVAKYRVSLGKHVAKAGLESRKENRLCNGTQRPVNLYKACPELDAEITAFFDAREICTKTAIAVLDD